MNKLIVLLGAMSLMTLVACDQGKETKPAAKPAPAATAKEAASKPAAKADEGKKAAAAKPTAGAAAAAAEPAKVADEAEVYAATILETDFDAEALREINEENAQAELDNLEKAIEGK